MAALLPAVLLTPTAAGAAPSPGAATRVCTLSQRTIAALPAPTTTDAAATGIATWLDSRVARQLAASRVPRLPGAVAGLEADLAVLHDALTGGDGPGATRALAGARSALGTVDVAAARDRLPRCSSRAFGRSYLAQVETLVAAALPLTGDFHTDADAACRRFDLAATRLQAHLDTKNLTSVETYLDGLQRQYEALQIDLAAVRPASASAERFATFQASIRTAVRELRSAGSALRNGNETALRQLGTQLTQLGDTVNRQAAGLGLTC